MSIAIVYDQTLIYSNGFGKMNITDPNSPAPTGDSIFRIGSCTKLFTALAISQLVPKMPQGFETPLANYYASQGLNIINPYSSSPSSPSSQITFRQVLSQLSGLQRETPCGGTLFCTWTQQQVFSALNNSELILPPYSLPSYSNLGFALVGNLIPSIVGLSYEAYLQQNILNPLGMSNTGYTITQQVLNQMVPSYYLGYLINSDYSLGWNGPAGQMFAFVSPFISSICLLSFLTFPFSFHHQVQLGKWFGKIDFGSSANKFFCFKLCFWSHNHQRNGLPHVY